MHVEINTINCGIFMVPINQVTIHCVGETTRVLIDGDPEWREVSAEVRLHVLSAIAENNKRLAL